MTLIHMPVTKRIRTIFAFTFNRLHDWVQWNGHSQCLKLDTGYSSSSQTLNGHMEVVNSLRE